MNLESYAMFLIGTILVSIAIIVMGLTLLLLNYIFSTHWRPINLGYWAPFWVSEFVAKTGTIKRFMTEEEFLEHQRQLAAKIQTSQDSKTDLKSDLNKF